MKTKLFKLEDLNKLQQFEDEVNAFTVSHDTVDVKITTCMSTHNDFYLIYVVLYNE